MTEWQPYEWAQIGGDPWRDWVTWMLMQLLKSVAQMNPEPIFTWPPWEDAPWPVDPGDGGGAGGNAGINIYYDPTNNYGFNPKPFQVISLELGEVDIQQWLSLTELNPAVIVENVTVPPAFGTPQVGDVGMAWVVSDGVVFLPSCRRPTLPSYVTTMGGADERAGSTAKTESWQMDTLGEGIDGVKLYYQSNVTYDDAGAQILYAYYEDMVFDEYGQAFQGAGETRVSVDVPGACP